MCHRSVMDAIRAGVRGADLSKSVSSETSIECERIAISRINTPWGLQGAQRVDDLILLECQSISFFITLGISLS